MCGIIGQVNCGSSKPALPKINLISHRGPDGSGEWKSKNERVYFGHTRLAILEPTDAGYQPMVNASKRYTLTFNGEIYNHLQLRPLVPGVQWRGNADTETLIELLNAKGITALKLLKGMFAFALHDETDDSVLLVRDRLGIKPLWLKTDNKVFSFSSEIRPLIDHDKFMPSVETLSEYIGFGRMPASGEISKGIRAIKPGSWFKIFKDGSTEEDTWWPGEGFVYPKPAQKSDCIKKVHQLVTTAIEEHLISDVGVGAFLSGGIDSSIVALIAGKKLGKRMQTFTVGFPQGDFDERSIARKVAEKAGSEHFELEVNENDCLSWVKEAVINLDLPSVDAINTYIVSKSVRQTGLKVALSGLGGDELFGGYPSFKNVPYLKLLNAFPKNISSLVVNCMPANFKEKLAGINSFSTTDLTIARRRFYSVAKLKAMGMHNGTPKIPAIPNDFDTMGKISWAEIQGYMLPMLLSDSDQMSMAVGLEIRVPFLDHILVEEVLSMPQQYKTGSGVKPLLVEAFRSELPEEVYNRPKQGFALPMDSWIRGPLAEFTNEGVASAAEILGIAEPLLQKDNFEKGCIHWTRLWSWCVLGHWLKIQHTVKEGNNIAKEIV